MTISEHVKQLRRQESLTQQDLADRAGVGIHFVRDLEQGKSTLRMDKVNDVLSLFGERLGAVKDDNL
ncbi:MAG: type II toxin-antitoxin system Y4mF family antitoxin [Bacteroidales bacterium]|nr:type II toxin-antitoxin system Y4mF family antitoxin [Bacteroidales bacterium]